MEQTLIDKTIALCPECGCCRQPFRRREVLCGWSACGARTHAHAIWPDAEHYRWLQSLATPPRALRGQRRAPAAVMRAPRARGTPLEIEGTAPATRIARYAS
ncbi:MAG: hypothetical protein ACLSGS_07680 [Adlercreutzia sp.]